ncbi:hypothetical protein AC578_10173 [Pseudocercospora eumusae]|uniref:RRM domain-containing protein n=1 Tax=Pseudocercospora eumusae TaxID=321146 RepID=A0A139HZ49_9PEZI|nr:hypothetical protein AC578_10173 [Pseudocercospora eumusae]
MASVLNMTRARRAQVLQHKRQGRGLESQDWRSGPATAAAEVKCSPATSWHVARSSKSSTPATVPQNGELSSMDGEQSIVIAGTRFFLQMTGGIPFLVSESEMARKVLKAGKITLAKERAQRIKKRQEFDASRKPIDTLYIGNLPAVSFKEEDTMHYRAEINASYEDLLVAELHECFATQSGFRRSYVRSHDGTPQALVQFDTVGDAVRVKENLDGTFLHFLKDIGRRSGLRLSFARNPILVGTSYKRAPVGIWEARAESNRQAQLQQSAVSTAAFGHYTKTNLGQQLSQQPKKLSAAAAAFVPEKPLFLVPVKKNHAVEIRPDPKKLTSWISPQKNVQPQAPTPDSQSAFDYVFTASDNMKNYLWPNSNSSSTSEAIKYPPALTKEQLMCLESDQCQNCGEQYEALPFDTIPICHKCEGFRIKKPQVFEQAGSPALVALQTSLCRMLEEDDRCYSFEISKASPPTAKDSSNRKSLICLACNRPHERADSAFCQVCDDY